MAVDYGFALTEAILELRILNERILTKNNVISKGLECTCKRIILEEYLISISNLMMVIANFNLTLEEIKDVDTLEYKFSFIKKLYRKTVCCRLFTNPKIEFKLLALFQIIYNSIEDNILDEIKNRTMKILKCGDTNLQYDVCKQNLDQLYDLAEHLILSLAGIQLDCKLLKPEIFNEPFIQKYIDICSLNLKTLLFNTQLDCCLIPDETFENSIHLFLTYENFIITDWLDNLIKYYSNYFMEPKKIAFIWDFKLIDPLIWNEELENKYCLMNSLFKSISFVNCPHIDFGEFLNNKNIISNI